MYKLKKRLGYINMNEEISKEILETIENDGEQMKLLYDEIEELKKIINKKDLIIKEKHIEISMLKDKIKILDGIIEGFRTKYETNNEKTDININDINISKNKKNEGSRKTNLDRKSEILNHTIHNDKIENNSYIKEYKINNFDLNTKCKEENKNTPIPTPSTSNDSKHINYENIKNAKNKIIKILIINYYKYKCKKIINLRNEKENSIVIPSQKKVRKERDKSLPILERFGTKHIKDDDIKDSEILRFVGEEDCFNIEYQYLVANKIDKKQENISIDDVVDFKIKYENKRNTRTRRKEYRYLIKRCNYLFDKYDKNLGKFKISLYNLRTMSDDDWNEWKIAFDNLYKEVFKDSIKCDIILKSGRNKGKPCNRLNCKIKHKNDI